MSAMIYGQAFINIEKWIDVNTEEGQRLLRDPNPRYALFDPSDCPEYSPQEWCNAADQSANCLAYAFNAHGQNLQPGRLLSKDQHEHALTSVFNERAKILASEKTPVNDLVDTVKIGLTIDGLETVTTTEGLYKPDHYLIAMFKVIHPHSDVHFARLDSNGTWSHFNLGSPHVSSHDLDEDKIYNPANANFGGSIQFEGFYHIPKGGLPALRAK